MMKIKKSCRACTVFKFKFRGQDFQMYEFFLLLKIAILERKTKDLDAPPLVDQLELIQQLRDDPKIGFYYMVYAVEQSSKYFTPYALKLIFIF